MVIAAAEVLFNSLSAGSWVGARGTDSLAALGWWLAGPITAARCQSPSHGRRWARTGFRGYKRSDRRFAPRSACGWAVGWHFLREARSASRVGRVQGLREVARADRSVDNRVLGDSALGGVGTQLRWRCAAAVAFKWPLCPRPLRERVHVFVWHGRLVRALVGYFLRGVVVW